MYLQREKKRGGLYICVKTVIHNRIYTMDKEMNYNSEFLPYIDQFYPEIDLSDYYEPILRKRRRRALFSRIADPYEGYLKITGIKKEYISKRAMLRRRGSGKGTHFSNKQRRKLPSWLYFIYDYAHKLGTFTLDQIVECSNRGSAAMEYFLNEMIERKLITVKLGDGKCEVYSIVAATEKE